ncbi:MAG TPA: hypothetical protein VHC43_06540 [Mycobacteriales bacterium]|nr:hypothetical protein [Mycobacteriales bacterium]
MAFYRDDEARVTGWNALRGKRTRIPGTVMALGRGDISHDLVQYVVEAATGYETGFWGLLSRGATFKSTGRKRTQPGRALIVEHRADLDRAEQIAGLHIAAWRSGDRTPVSIALERAAEQFSGLAPGEEVVFDWPSAAGEVSRRGLLGERPAGAAHGCRRAAGGARSPA